MGRFWIKCLMNGIVVIPLLMWFTEATFWGAVGTALALSIISYVLGDQMILRASNNTVATLADVGVALALLWIIADYANWSLSVGELLTLGIAVGVVEAIFHRMLGRMDTRAT